MDSISARSNFGNLRSLRRERAAPCAVHRQRQLGAQASCRIVDRLEQRTDRNALASAQIFSQLSDHSFKFGENNV
jgi:hypothetical protein